MSATISCKFRCVYRAYDTKNLDTLQKILGVSDNNAEKDKLVKLSEKQLSSLGKIIQPSNSFIQPDEFTTISDILKKLIDRNNPLQLTTKRKIVTSLLLYMGVKKENLSDPEKVFEFVDKYTAIKYENNEWKKENLDEKNKKILLKEYFSHIAKGSTPLDSLLDEQPIDVRNVVDITMSGKPTYRNNGDYGRIKSAINSYWDGCLKCVKNDDDRKTVLYGFMSDKSLSENLRVLIVSSFFEKLRDVDSLAKTSELLVDITKSGNFKYLDKEAKEILFRGYAKHLCHSNPKEAPATGWKIWKQLLGEKSPKESALSFLILSLSEIYREATLQASWTVDKWWRKFSNTKNAEQLIEAPIANKTTKKTDANTTYTGLQELMKPEETDIQKKLENSKNIINDVNSKYEKKNETMENKIINIKNEYEINISKPQN